MVIALFFLGLCFGSFVNALVWRLRHNRDFVSERSECPRCHHQLSWNDLLPIVSWLWLKGACRYCRKPISWQYPLVEFVTAVLFVVSYYAWPLTLITSADWLYFGLWLFALVIMVALAVYDALWYELPDKLTASLAVVAVAMVAVQMLFIQQTSLTGAVVYVVASLLPIAGLYGVLYLVSNKQWVGLGDVKLGVGLGLILGWELALLAVFIANAVGLLAVIPGLLSRKLSRKSNIPFGPFLIIGAYLSFLFGRVLIDWYFAGVLYL
ncbi:MAG: prepilin peptidase [Candidatus Saccharimonadales bacterium]